MIRETLHRLQQPKPDYFRKLGNWSVLIGVFGAALFGGLIALYPDAVLLPVLTTLFGAAGAAGKAVSMLPNKQVDECIMQGNIKDCPGAVKEICTNCESLKKND